MNKTTMAISILVAAAIAVLGYFSFAQDFELGQNPVAVSEADQQMAHDLAVMSGLTEEDVLKLYEAIGNWDTVRDNIFVYKRILQLVQVDPAAFEQAFRLAGKFSPEDMLTVYEFLAVNDKTFDRAENLLAEKANGMAMETVLASRNEQRNFENYRPASEEQVRSWLGEGYLPEDILNADAIAQAKDRTIESVIALKSEATSWEEIGDKLLYEFEEENQTVAITIKNEQSVDQIQGQDYESIVRQANQTAENKKADLEMELISQYGLDKKIIEDYKSQGLTVRDLQNAAKLARKTGSNMDQILSERQKGKSWESIIQAYTS